MGHHPVDMTHLCGKHGFTTSTSPQTGGFSAFGIADAEISHGLPARCCPSSLGNPGKTIGKCRFNGIYSWFMLTKLVPITSRKPCFMIDISILNGVYEPTFTSLGGAPACVHHPKNRWFVGVLPFGAPIETHPATNMPHFSGDLSAEHH